jgi:hypothetical protein
MDHHRNRPPALPDLTSVCAGTVSRDDQVQGTFELRLLAQVAVFAVPFAIRVQNFSVYCG